LTRRLALAWLLYGNQLAAPQRQTLQQVLHTAKTGVVRHPVAITYTNIWLMKTWNLIALGEGLDDDALARQGYTMLGDWLAHTRRTGINEYLSPSYYDVDLESLALISKLSRSPQARQQAREALDLFWHDIALNWYAPAQRLGGTHSRDYNRLFNAGGVNDWVNRAGWTGAAAKPLVGPYDNLAWAEPPDSARAWSKDRFPGWSPPAGARHPEALHPLPGAQRQHCVGRSWLSIGARQLAAGDQPGARSATCPSSTSSWTGGATTTDRTKPWRPAPAT